MLFRSQAVAGAGTSPFMTWPELRALHAEGTLDVQSHTFSHAMIDTSAQPAAFVDPRYGESSSFLARPLIDDGLDEVPRRRPRFVTPADLGAPLYRTRSRMSDAPRILHAPAVREACLDLVRSEGGEAFFSTRRWHARLTDIAGHANAGHRTESDDEHQRHIERELEDARTEIDHQIGARVVRHVCLPWGVSGRRTEAALKRLGFSTAIANRMPGTFAVRPGDDPFWLKRLPNRYIFRLPGHGRRWPFAARS